MGKDALINLSDSVAQRTLSRMEGLTDEEYRWSPIEGAWTAGDDGRGDFFLDYTTPEPVPAPFTTLAWRLHHLMGTYSADRNPLWLQVPSTGDPLQDPAAQPTDAGRAVALLRRCQATWRGYLTAVSDDVLDGPLGAKAAPWAESTGADLVLHQIDEQIHHGAEVALLRDLYRATNERRDPMVSALLRGELSAVDEIDAVRAAHPHLLTEVAFQGRWDAVRRLVELGFAVDAPEGRTALHQAAGNGRADIVRLLVAHGADLSRVDPEWHATPQGWAEFFGHSALAEELATPPPRSRHPRSSRPPARARQGW